MASIEFITKRIEGKQAEIAKLEKKIARIEKAKATGWEVNPYYYHEDDLKWANRDLTNAREALAKYQADYAREVEKENSRNVQAILDFLNMWADRVYAHYEETFPKYVEAKKEYYRKDSEYCEWFNHGGFLKDERQAKREELRKYQKAFHTRWNWIAAYEKNRFEFDGDKLKAELEQDKKHKYDDIVERANAIVGTITDARGLYVGNKGELNGIVIGDRGRARIETIGAGGYNIQCFHFRTLIHEIK